MTVWDTMITVTVLVAMEFRVFCTHVIILPLPSLNVFDGCAQSFSVCYGLNWSNRGIVVACHNKVYDEILYLSLRAFPSQFIRGEPLIHQGRRISGEEVRQVRGELETRGYVIIRGL